MPKHKQQMRIMNPYGNLDFYQSNIITTHVFNYECPKSNKTTKTSCYN
jgi:hypothetical protein